MKLQLPALLSFILLFSLLATLFNPFAFGPASAQAVDLTSGLVGHWTFDNCDAADSSGNGHDGTLIGELKCIPGVNNEAITFNGTDTAVNLGIIDSINSNASFTITGWIILKNYSDSWNSVIFSNRKKFDDIGNSAGFLFGVVGLLDSSPKKLELVINGGDHAIHAISNRDIITNTWYHASITFSHNTTINNTIKLYLDGILESTTIAPDFITPGLTISSLGFELNETDVPKSYHFDGTLDDVRIYNRALSQEEISQLYSSAANSPVVDHFDIKATDGTPLVSQQINTPFDITITARNAFGNTVSEFNGPVSLSSFGINQNDATLANGAWSGKVKMSEVAAKVRIAVASKEGLVGYSDYFSVTGTGTSTGSVSGKVTNNYGDPVYDATLFIAETKNGSSLYSAKSRWLTGSYTFYVVPSGQYYIWAEKDGVVSRRIPIDVHSFWPVSARPLVLDLVTGSEIPVVLVPGMLGSSAEGWNTHPVMGKTTYYDQSELHLHDPMDRPGWWQLETSLYFKSIHYIESPWDWRMPLDRAVDEYLIPAIDRAKKKSPTGKVNIIAHSMGGLLVRSYIQSDRYRKDIENFSMVGTPNQGSANAYYLWEGGDPKTIDDLTDYILDAGVNLYWQTTESLYEDTYKLGSLKSTDYPSIVKLYINHVPTARQLLPTYGFLSFSLKKITAAGNVNTYLEDLNSDPRRMALMGPPSEKDKIKTRMYFSQSEDTIYIVNVSPLAQQRYADGVPNGAPLFMKDGDGTVRQDSARFSCNKSENWAECLELSGPHSKLINTGKDKIISDMYPATTAMSSVNSMAISTLEVSPSGTLSLIFTGRVAPLVTDSLGQKIGVDQVSGEFVEEISGGSVTTGTDVSTITLKSPADGAYTIDLVGRHPGDVSLELSCYDSAGNETRRKIQWFNDTTPASLKFILDSALPDITINHAPQPPLNLLADAVGTTDLTTRLTWQGTGELGVTGYNIYSRFVDEPYLAKIGITSETTFDTGHPWAKDATIKTRIYAVAAIKNASNESFLTLTAKNNDRDHDGLTDVEEASLGTDPTKADSDGDGFSDYTEVLYGGNPLDKNSVPTTWLSVNLSGTGGGKVTSDPAGIACTYPPTSGGACGWNFPMNSVVKLITEPNKDSLLTWSGACTGSGTCAPVMSEARDATALFHFVKPAKVGATLYDTLTAAYGDSAAGTILARQYTLIGDFTLDADKAINLRGGYDASYTAQTGVTTIKGKLTIDKGSLTADRVVIR